MLSIRKSFVVSVSFRFIFLNLPLFVRNYEQNQQCVARVAVVTVFVIAIVCDKGS